MLSDQLVTVIMPVFNGERFLEEAISSILAQEYGGFTFLIVNDGSTDATAAIVDRFQRSDNRVRGIHASRIGFAAALNLACELATTKYVARMDADDISLPGRLSRQVAFLEENPNVSVCGTAAELFGAAKGYVTYPASTIDVRCVLLFSCCLCHPSVMMRRSLFGENGYRFRPEFGEASDYALWVDISQQHELVNLPDVLIRYRQHPGQISHSARTRQLDYANRIRVALLGRLGITPDEEEQRIHEALSSWKHEPSIAFVRVARNWLHKLSLANTLSHTYDHSSFNRFLSTLWYAVCRSGIRTDPRVLLEYGRSHLCSDYCLSLLKLAYHRIRQSVSRKAAGSVLSGVSIDQCSRIEHS